MSSVILYLKVDIISKSCHPCLYYFVRPEAVSNCATLELAEYVFQAPEFLVLYVACTLLGVLEMIAVPWCAIVGLLFLLGKWA